MPRRSLSLLRSWGWERPVKFIRDTAQGVMSGTVVVAGLRFEHEPPVSLDRDVYLEPDSGLVVIYRFT